MGQSGTWISEAHLDHDNASRLSKRRSNKSLATTMTQHSVEVLSQRYALHVYQYADNLWIAEGAFLGQQLRTIERTVQKAVHAWQKAAVEKRLFGDDWLTGKAGALNGLPRELRHNRARYSACNTREKGPASSKVCSSRSLILTNLPATVRVVNSTAGGHCALLPPHVGYRNACATAPP